jgi:hypothetical protein
VKLAARQQLTLTIHAAVLVCSHAGLRRRSSLDEPVAEEDFVSWLNLHAARPSCLLLLC